MEMRKSLRTLAGLALLITGLCVWPQALFAATTPVISLTPVQGGTELTFRGSPGSTPDPAEVRFRITNVTARYEIRMSLSTPISNGRYTINWNTLTYRGLRGTNSMGTFHSASDAYMPLMSVNPIYTNTSGQQDNFTLVFSLNIPGDAPAGLYRGAIQLVENPLTSGQNKVFRTLNVVVNVTAGSTPPPSEVAPDIEIIPQSSLSTIRLNSKKEEKQIADVQVKINKDIGRHITIYQAFELQPESSQGNKLDYTSLNYNVTNTRLGTPGAVSPTPFNKQYNKIYESAANGQCDNVFDIVYTLGDLSKQKAGNYRGNLQYFLQKQDGPARLVKTLAFELENEKIFDLVITPEEQKTAIEFTNIKANDPPKKNEITLEVKSNLGKQYQVSQTIFSELTNAAGVIIPFANFTITEENLDTKGTLKIPQKVPVSKTDTVLFVSDKKGSADKFKLIYELTVPDDVRAGDYSTRITYSLLEI